MPLSMVDKMPLSVSSKKFRAALPFIVLASLGLGFITGALTTRTLPLLRDVQLDSLVLSLYRGNGCPDCVINRDNQPRRGHVHDSLVRQGLSHGAFHAIPFKQRLAALVSYHKQVAIVGVEWGAEAYALAEDGNVVNAFEPHPLYYAKMAERVAKDSRFRLHNIAIGPERGSFQLVYREMSKQVQMAPLSDFISTELDLISVDVQRHYPGVIKGATGLKIRSMWIEVFPCNNDIRELLHQLDKHYVIFDFVPWGGLKGTNKETPLSELGKKVGWSSRPTDIDSYLTWFCDAKKKYYNWLGTDIVAIRRDVLTPSILNKLNIIGNDAYVQKYFQHRKA